MINGSDVQAYGSSGCKYTFAHEVGHNFGLGHSDFGAGSGTNLMTAGSFRLIPGGVADITPDGAKLSQLTKDQQDKLLTSPFLVPVPKVLIDTRGSTPFDSDDFFLVDFKSGGNNIFLKSLTVDISPVAAFFDSTDESPGNSSSPFALSMADLLGITASDITLVGGSTALNGKQQLKLTFADNAFNAGGSFRFGVDMDSFSTIDSFGAEPSELIGSLISFEFSDGFAVKSALGSDLTASSSLPIGLPNVVVSPSGGPILPPGTIPADPDPVPGPLPALGLISAYGFSKALRKRIKGAMVVG